MSASEERGKSMFPMHTLYLCSSIAQRARRKVKPQKEDVEHPPKGPAAILQFLGGVKHQAVEIVVYTVVEIPARLLSTHQISRTPFNQKKKGKNKKTL